MAKSEQLKDVYLLRMVSVIVCFFMLMIALVGVSEETKPFSKLFTLTAFFFNLLNCILIFYIGLSKSKKVQSIWKYSLVVYLVLVCIFFMSGCFYAGVILVFTFLLNPILVKLYALLPILSLFQ